MSSAERTDTVVAGGLPEPRPRRPVFIAGPDRSGTSLMFALLASHPNLSMVRRSNMWRYFHGRFGDLRDPANLDRCLDEMTRYRRLRHLRPDRERILREFLQGPPTYGHLFALFHEHHAERAGKPRWGDKSLHTEHYADAVFAEFPQARVIHMVRDPRDRYASVRKRHGRDLSRVGPVTARWLGSTRAARRNAARHPRGYLIVRYEDLAREPEVTMRRVCDFIGEPFEPAMFSMAGAPEHREGNSSFGELEPGAISTRGIGRFVDALAPWEIAFVQSTAGREMAALGYERTKIELSPAAALRYLLWQGPLHRARMFGWSLVARVTTRRGAKIPTARLEEPASAGDDRAA